jgi:O-antigen/teichoic acid export membrane protein
VMSLGVMLAALVGAVFFGDRVLALFGSDYAGGQWALVILMAGQTLRSASGMNINLLSLGGHQSRIALSCMTAFALMVAVASFLAPRYGVLGVAVAALTADAVWAISLGILVRGLTGRAGDIFAFTSALTAAPGNRHNLAQR